MNSLVCVDANGRYFAFIVWFLVPSPLSDAVEALLEKWQQEQVPLISPALLACECTSTLRRLFYLNEITPPEG